MRDNFNVQLPKISKNYQEGVKKVRKYEENAEVYIIGYDKIELRNILNSLFEQVNSQVFESLNKSFDRYINNQNNNRLLKLSDIDLQIKHLKAIYFDEINARINHLSEQLLIAESIGQTSNIFNIIENDVLSSEGKNLDYLRGYNVLEKELETLRERTDHEKFIPELIELNSLHRAVKSDQFIDRIKEAYAQSPLKDINKFAAVNYNLDKVKYEKVGITKLLFTAMMIILILLLNFILIFTKYFLRKI